MENESLFPKTNPSSFFFYSASFALVIMGLLFFEDIIKPLVIAFLIWFIINQIKITLGKIRIKGWTIPSWIRSILAFAIIFLVLYLIFELLVSNIEGIASSMPEYISNFHKSYNEATSFINDPHYTAYLQNWIKTIDLSGMATSVLSSLSGIVASSAVVFVYVLFFILEETSYLIKQEKLFPVKGKRYKSFTGNLEKVRASIRYYIWSMTLISLLTGVISYPILLLMNVEYAFLWSFLIFILNYIPYIGALISSIFPAVFAVVTSSDLMQFVYVFAAMEGVQIVMGDFVQPLIMGKGANLSPVVVIVALAFWGFLWGIVGMILAIPITAVIVIICSQIPSTRFLAILLSGKGDIPEIRE